MRGRQFLLISFPGRRIFNRLATRGINNQLTRLISRGTGMNDNVPAWKRKGKGKRKKKEKKKVGEEINSRSRAFELFPFLPAACHWSSSCIDNGLRDNLRCFMLTGELCKFAGMWAVRFLLRFVCFFFSVF